MSWLCCGWIPHKLEKYCFSLYIIHCANYDDYDCNYLKKNKIQISVDLMGKNISQPVTYADISHM